MRQNRLRANGMPFTVSKVIYEIALERILINQVIDLEDIAAHKGFTLHGRCPFG